jgi:thiol-disulfide isomerase/thioredoxin
LKPIHAIGVSLLSILPAFGLDESARGPAADEARLELHDLDGRKVGLEEHRGRIVVVNFWATWCLPCREEMPILASLQERYAVRGVQVIGASTDAPADRDKVARLARRLKLNFPVWIGATTEEMRGFGLGEALPATALVDRDGRIAGRILGLVDAADLDARLEWLLGDRRGPAPPPVVDSLTGSAHDHADHPGHHHEGEGHAGEAGGHADEEDHEHGGVGMEGASLVPS